jgi:uncharacterized membrane protein
MTMTEESQVQGYQLLVGAFGDEGSAANAVSQLKAAFRHRRGIMPAAASLARDAGGDLTIEETNELDSKTGAIAGGVAGGLLGLLGGRRGALLGAGIGAVLGSVAAQRLDTGIPDDRLENIGNMLDNATSAAACIIADGAADEARDILKGLGATIDTEPFTRDTDFMKQLQSGNYAGAFNSLAGQAETAMSGATVAATEVAQKVAEQAKGAVGQTRKAGEDAAPDLDESIPVT